LRGAWHAGTWHAGLFRTTNRDDILFISAGALTNQGFFDNVGRTRRAGVELNFAGEIGERFNWFANLTQLEATFRETLTIASPNNPAAIDGEVTVSPGDELPLVPNRLFKSGMRFAVTESLSINANLLAGSDFHLRGDEGNDGNRIGRYALVNLSADYLIRPGLRLFLNIDNLFDEDYETFGLFGEPDEVLGDAFDDSRFFSPSAPRAAWLGVQFEF
jgi:outer membrane receptor protein involved in Fe transport